MFRKQISQTRLSDKTADRYFEGRIWGDNVGSDRTFIATLRALFDRRLPEGETIVFRYSVGSSSSYTADHLREWEDHCDTVHLMAFSAIGAETKKALMDSAAAAYDADPGWTKLPKPTEYYASTMAVLVYVNPATKAVVIFTDTTDIRKIHFLEAGMLSFFPWLFNPSDGFSANERALCESLMKSDETDYLTAISAIADELGFRAKAQKKLLDSFETNGDRKKIDEVKSSIRSKYEDIENYRSRINGIFDSVHEDQIMLLGLETKLASGAAGALGDYFETNKSLVFITENENGTFDFGVRGYLSYWDDDLVERCVENRNSILYAYNNIDRDDLHDLYKAVFVDRKIKLRVCAAFRMRPNQIPERPHPYDFSASEFGTYMPNTHIDQFACIGRNDDVIIEMIKSSDYIGVLEQCVASTLGFNFGDSTVMRMFASVICGANGGYKPNTKAFELPTGEITDPKGAIEWLKRSETKESEG